MISSHILKINLFVIGVCLFISNHAKEVEEAKPTEERKKGNYSLCSSQQPMPLFGFGQNILGKGDLQGYLFMDQLKAKRNTYAEVEIEILYGIRDNLSLFAVIPFATHFQEGNLKSRGIEDCYLQLEWAYAAIKKPKVVIQGTLLTNISFPTGSTKKTPPTGYGSPTVFLGTTLNCMSSEWYAYFAPGVLFTTKHKGTEFGNNFYYEFGLGRNFAYKTNKWLFNGLLEFIGIYTQRDLINGLCDPNSGGNIFYIAPSLWFSTQRLIIQAGIGVPVGQHLFGVQSKYTYFGVLNIGWLFS